jgi:Putative beta-barrel porin-2, OmpL-like. bbp2
MTRALIVCCSLLSASAFAADPELEKRIEALEKELAAVKAQQAATPPAAAMKPAPTEPSPAPAPTSAPWYSQITWNAFVSASYTWNFNNPLSKINKIRAMDYDHNSFRVDTAELVLQKAVSNPGDFGFRTDVVYGATAVIGAARGLFRDPVTGVAQQIDLQQAFVSYIVPVGHGLRVDFGKFVTNVGAEYLDGYDGYNDNFSRSILFNWAIAFTHTGLRFSYTFSDKLTLAAMLVNGWDNFLDNNQAKSFGLFATITPHPTLNLYVN